MTGSRTFRWILVGILVLLLVGGATLASTDYISRMNRTHIVAYFDNSNGLFKGDEVRILGVRVGEIEAIEPQPDQVKITMWVDDKYPIPAKANAAILSPQLVTARAVQLTPAYTGGPVMRDGAVIPKNRTAVPVEWDDLRVELSKLTKALQPTEPGGVSTLGAFVNTAADNLRGQGGNIRDTIVKLSQTISILGDHSGDLFGTLKNLATVVSALEDSASLMRQLNSNLATVSGLLTDDPGEVGRAMKDLSSVVGDTTSFIKENRDAVGITGDKLASISTALNQSIPDLKQALHIFPNVFQNYLNIIQPTQAALTGALALNNFSNPLNFICGAIQAASRLNADQSAKLCEQYLAPIVKNRQYNFLPLGLNPIVGESARPNEITYSEDWMRPDNVPAPAPTAPGPAPNQATPPLSGPLPAEVPAGPPAPSLSPVTTDPATGLQGMMIPGSGS